MLLTITVEVRMFADIACFPAMIIATASLTREAVLVVSDLDVLVGSVGRLLVARVLP